MYLIAGLGNPGHRYERTRHNAGFMLVDSIADRSGASFSRMESRALICSIELASREVVLAKPQTFMNRSGRSVLGLVRRFAVELSRVLVVYDEVALPLGTIRLRARGSSAGQLGMQSIIDSLETEAIPRLRLGVRGEHAGSDLSEYVLGPFKEDEWPVFRASLDRARSAVETYLSEGIEKSMALYNTRPQTGGEEGGEES